MNLSDTTIGIVIGSGFTVLGVMVQGAISWFLNWKTHKMTLDEQCKKEKRAKAEELWHKKEAAYKTFVDIVGLSLMMADAVSKQSASPIPEDVSNGHILKEMSGALTSILLYGSSKIADDVDKFMKHLVNALQFQQPSPQDIDALDKALENLAKDMKSDLLQCDLKSTT